MTIIQKLHWLEKNSIIYNIHYCNAGVGITFYVDENVKDRTLYSTKLFGKIIENENLLANWRDGLTTYNYYSSFEGMIKAEYKRVKAKLNESKS